jgi:hypothetical protein
MRKRSRLLSVAFTQLALLIALFAVPAAGQVPAPSSPTTVLNWIPQLSSSLATSTVCDFFTPTSCPAFPTTVKVDTGLIPMWLCSSGPQCANYQFAMIGNDPTAKNGSAVTITTRIIPLRVASSSPAVVFDPENNDSCSPSRTPALNMVQNSPMFVHLKISTLPVALQLLGSGQYASLFQRASFWTYINPKATSPKPINPNYQVDFLQVLLDAEERNATTIQIIDPGTAIDPTMPYQINGTVMTDSNWCNPLAVIEVNQLDALLQGTIIPKLKGAGVTPTTLPIFLLSNVAMYDSTQPCCILSYHNAYKSITTGATAGRLQTYIVANYDSTYCVICKPTYTGAFPNAPDITALSTVIPGWMDNPTTLNVTPGWSGTINGVTSPPCHQTALEVGFPSGLTLQPITMPSKVVYHVQDLAFKSWFYGDGGSSSTPNSGFGAAYSLFGNFGVPAATCP